MKKAVLWTLSALLVSSGALAAEKVGMDAQREAHRMEMKAIKQAQREAKAKNQPVAGAKAESKMAAFWKKEGERSGLGESGSNMGTFFKNLNPAHFLRNQEDAYNARKGGAAAK